MAEQEELRPSRKNLFNSEELADFAGRMEEQVGSLKSLIQRMEDKGFDKDLKVDGGIRAEDGLVFITNLIAKLQAAFSNSTGSKLAGRGTEKKGRAKRPRKGK